MAQESQRLPVTPMVRQVEIPVITMAIAPPRPSKQSTEVVAYLVQLMNSLPEQERDLFLKELERATDQAITDDEPQRLSDMLLSWERLVVARRDPDYAKNMARANEPLGASYNLPDLRKKFPKSSEAP